MKDVYAMSLETGELVPVTKVIREFYKTHNALDAWTDLWEPTSIPVEDSDLAAPDFLGALNI